MERGSLTPPDLAAFLNPVLCANPKRNTGGRVSHCQNVTKKICGSCKLVQYCSRKCQLAHRTSHNELCKSNLMDRFYVPRYIQENRVPAFMGCPPQIVFGEQQYLWGNVPALDILNIRDNKSNQDPPGNLDLLFGASGDLRNVIKTVLGLPDAYDCGKDRQCSVVINDLLFPVVARNIMLLLVAFHFEPDAAVPIMIHLWYSALLPAVMLETLQDPILPYIEKMCDALAHLPDDHMSLGTWGFGAHSSILVLLKKKDWLELKRYFHPPEGLAMEDANTLRRKTTLAPERVDYVDRALYKQPPGMRAGTYKFREDGILLPFGASRADFDTPNPTLFRDWNMWPMADSADPLGGWCYKEYIQHATIARNDVYGSLFFFLRDQLLRFCIRLKQVNIAFRFLNCDARDLCLHCHFRFDRIEVSNICDRSYIGVKATLTAFSPLLKNKSENTNATLLLLFMNAVPEEDLYGRKGQTPTNVEQILKKVDRFWDIESVFRSTSRNPSASEPLSPALVFFAGCVAMFGDFDTLFSDFLRDIKFERWAKQFGLKIRDKHSIIEPWPFRIKESSTQEEFKISCATGNVGHERYLELEKLEGWEILEHPEPVIARKNPLARRARWLTSK
ncbi:hypothetical protein P154DRAFT_586027 [Amniculicola lignicola CBS 123094]|uniref:Uncharacterized protein n=1 Tax=Amniculicola lignicola CBS 123094 TaxID=1392246 RepID=A0A6A5W9M0_9PLEO|nr:hypothetical protein P154DRAFT_586027 [Amniculicola lignicola CBS 123094]